MMLTPRRAVDLAADHLRDRILNGVWPIGSHLPAERQLAAELGISRLTLRAALARLESEGLVQPKQGSGVRVLDHRQTAGVELLVHLLDRGDPGLLAPFLVLRRALAAEAVAVACRAATDADLDALGAMAAELAVAPRDALIDGNLVFSREIVRLADNLPLALLFNTVARATRARPEIASAMLRNEAGVRASFAAIVALLRARDPDRARELVRRTLEALDATTLEAP